MISAFRISVFNFQLSAFFQVLDLIRLSNQLIWACRRKRQPNQNPSTGASRPSQNRRAAFTPLQRQIATCAEAA